MTNIGWLDKLQKATPIAALLLSFAVLYTGVIQKTAINTQATTATSAEVGKLDQSVSQLQVELSGEHVATATQLASLQEQEQRTHESVQLLADEFHNWELSEKRAARQEQEPARYDAALPRSHTKLQTLKRLTALPKLAVRPVVNALQNR